MIFLFGDCKLDMYLQALYRDSQAIHLQPRVFNLLVYLIEHRNRVVSRDELYEQIWPRQFIASATLESAIKLTRQAIGDSGRKQSMIKTFHKRGYRFVASVEQRQEPDSQEPSHSDHASGSTTRPQHMCLPFVGRQHELAILSAQLESAKHGQGRAVVLSGECGIGKSRLLDEFQSRLSTQEVTRLQGSCLPSQTLSPYWVIRQLIRQCFDLGAGEGSDAIRTKVQTRLVEIGLTDIKMASSILDLMGFETRSDQIAVLPPERLMVRTMDMICQIFIASSRQHPLFIAVEDLQWIDPTSDNCIALLMAQIARAPILLLMTHSSAYQPRWEEEVTHLALTPLTEAHSHTIMHELSDQTQVPDHLRQAVVTAAAGNPLYVEIGLRLIAEQEAAENDVMIPASLNESLPTMIRYLSQGTQQLLHIAAILGPKFSKSLLEAMWARQDDFETCLVELEARQWFQTLPSEAERTYVFTHVFMQEAVYASLSITDRQRLHTAASRILESLPRTQETVNMLAYHYTRSEQWYQAMASLTHLAELAVGYGAYKEALVRLREADRDAEHLHMAQRPHCRLELIIKQAQILLALGRFDEVLALFRQQEPLLNQTQDHRLHSRFLFLCSQTQSALGNWSHAAQHAQRAVALATQLEDVTILGQAASIWAMERYWAGHLVKGAELSQRAITALQGRQEPTALGMAYLVLALNTLVLGDFSKTLYATNQARSLAAVSEDAQMQSFADWVEGWAQATYGEWEAAITQCQCSLDYAPDPLSSALAMGWLGYAHLEKGNAMEAIARLEEAVQGLHQFAYHRLEGLFLSFLAAAHLACHDINKAHHLAQQSLFIVSEQGYRFGIGSAQRMLGKLAHAANAPDTAEVHLKNALTTFEDMQARFEVGRTHLDLAALAQLQDRRGVARIHCTTALKQFSDLQVPRYIELAQNHYGDL